MLDFGTRQVNKQGGSYMIALPMDWIKTQGIDMRTVSIELNNDGSLRIAAGTPRQEYPACNHA